MSKRKWFFISQCLVACALIIVLLISILGVPWVQAWSTNPSENTAICTAANDQRNHAVVSDGLGGAIITWEDYRSGSEWNIYAQRVDLFGIPQWTADGLAICTASNDQQNPAIVSDGSGGAIITWHDYRSDSWDIYAQRVNPSGVPQWTENGVAVCTESYSQRDPHIASDGSGGAIVVWEDYRDPNLNIYVQRVNPSGVPQWTANGVAICTAPNNQYDPAIASDGSGGAIVTWEDLRSTDYDIYTQRVNALGVPQWTADGVAVCTATDGQDDPAVVSDGSGGAIIAWQDYRNSYDKIYVQRISASGIPQWTANGVSVCSTSDGQQERAVVSDGSGGVIVVWEDHRSTYEHIYAQRLNSSGIRQWTADGVAICTATDNQWYPAVAMDSSGDFIVTWEDYRSGGNVYAQRVNPSGIPQWTVNGVAICTAPNEQWYPTPVSDGSGGAIVTWRDQRSGGWDIYAQRVNADGSLSGIVPTVTPTPTPTLPPSGLHTWSFCTAGFFPQHMPDSFTGEILLSDLNPATIPPEMQGVYWYDCSTSAWKFWAPGVPGTTLTTLGGGHTYDYMVTVTGDCDWEIPLP